MNLFLLRFLGWPVAAGTIAALILLWLFPALSTQPGNHHADDTQLHEPASYATAVRRAAPSVVNIYSRKQIRRARHPLLDDPIIQRLTNSATPRTRETIGLGSGVVLSAEGYIITNLHVVSGANQIFVQLQDGRSVEAEVAGSDKLTDLTILRVDIDNLIPIRIGDPMAAQVGDVVLAIGNPQGVGQTVTQGIISATGQRNFGNNRYQDSIQTDAAINPGNSGGALVDVHGRLLGINSGAFDNAAANRQNASGINTYTYGISFAIPVNTAIKVLNDIREYGHVVRGFIGEISISELSKMQLQELGFDYQSGLLVTDLSNGPASSAGLRTGDIIIGIGGQRRTDRAYLSKIMFDLAPQDPLTLDIVRGNRELQITITASVTPAIIQQ